MTLIDLSVPIRADIHADPPSTQMEIECLGHDASAPRMVARFPGLHVQDLPEGKGWAVERLRLSTHNGTHMDAPWHYHPTMDAGAPSMTIDQVPLHWCMQPGVKLDFRHFPDGYVVTPDDIDAELARIGHRLSPLEIILVNTAAGSRYAMPGYTDTGCGMGRAATLHLTRHGIRVVGTDAWNWDAPLSHTARQYAETGDASIIWEGHKAGIDTGYCQMEKLHNLDQLPDSGFIVICFPVKIDRASAGWAWVVAQVGGARDD